MNRQKKTHQVIPSQFCRKPATRRRFLGLGSSAAALTILSSSIARGSQVSSRITTGLVGLGGRGSWIANHLLQHPGYQITAVADYFPDVAQTAGERLNVAKENRYAGLGGYQRVIDSKVDAVFLETPPCFFPIHAEAAVKAGCHVFMAKPVAVDVPGCLLIRDLAIRSTMNNRVFLVDFQTRTDPFHIEAIRRVHAGEIGKVGLVTSFYHDECFADPPKGPTIENLLQRLAWVNDTALGGSYIVNCDIHPIDVGLWIAGEVPVSATGYSCRNRPNAQGDTHDSYAVSFEFPSGAVMTDQSEHIRNATGFRAGCHAYGQTGHLETNYGGQVHIRGGMRLPG